MLFPIIRSGILTGQLHRIKCINNKAFVMYTKTNQIESRLNYRGIKNFGHKYEPPATHTVVWHWFILIGIITFAVVDFEKVGNLIFGEPEKIDDEEDSS